MTEKKQTITRAQALEIAIAAIKDTNPDAAAALQKMHASITKPRTKASGLTKTQRENAELAAKVLAVMPEGEAVGTRWICEHVQFIQTPQKATAVMKMLVDAEKVTKLKVGKAMTYTKL